MNRRGKNRKGYNGFNTNQTPEDNCVNMEMIVDRNERSENEDTDSQQTDDVSDSNGDARDYEVMDTTDRTGGISLDGIMVSPPQILEPETYDKKEVDFVIEKEEVKYEDYNRRALSKFATTYELEKFDKNCLIIFNQENVDGFNPRYGTEKDVQSLTSTFSDFGFEVTEHKDFTKDEVFKELKLFSERDFTDYGCIAVAILTHGTYQGMLWAKDQKYNEVEVINHFKAYEKPTLVTKPKLLIIQACRGKDRMDGVQVLKMSNITRDFEESLEPYTLPAESDMLILHSSYIGHASHRDEVVGSWFIQTLCLKINQLASSHDFESIVTEVKREVAIEKCHEDCNRRTYETDINKQMPVTTSTLIRKLYLKKYGDKSVYLTTSYNDGQVSRNEVLDNSAPSTPMAVHFGQCSCFLDYFTYIRQCLCQHLEKNPHDAIAKNYLQICETLNDSTEFYTTKKTISKIISDYMNHCAKEICCYKYLYLYNHKINENEINN
ncbi:caspase-1-like [Battus philenor]|uniref:caspase-1-like n=1 Tax=Battus philenor TaxID=42288 RepID=UPI0035CEE498